MSTDKPFVSSWIEDEVLSYCEEKDLKASDPSDRREINAYLYSKYPEVPRRTLREGTLNIGRGEYRTSTTNNHFTSIPTNPLIPKKYSQRDYYHNLMVDLLTHRQKSNRRLRLANAQDLHRDGEGADPALYEILLQILSDFKPDYVPAMCDVTDNSLLASEMHGTSHSKGYPNLHHVPGADPDLSPLSQAMTAFETIHVGYAEDLFAATGNPDLIHPTWGGNHEAWAFRYFHNSEGGFGYFIDKFMTAIKDAGIIWTDPFRYRELWVTDEVIAVHGWMSRSSYPGSTARGYMKHYDSQVSVFAGHSHRQNTMWSKPSINGGAQRFYNITGTLGPIRPSYNAHAYSGHNPGVTLAYLAPQGSIGHELVDVRMYWVNGYWEASWNGKLYRERAHCPNPYETPLKLNIG